MNKTLWRAAVLAGLLGGGLLACAKAPAADPQRAALEAAIHRWVAAVNAQDVAALNETMTEDVELLDGAAAVKGREAAVGELREGATRGQLGAVTRELTMANDIAWHVVALARTQPNGDVQAGGQALEIWQRAQGQWRLHRRMVAGDLTQEISLTRPTKEPVLDRPKN